MIDAPSEKVDFMCGNCSHEWNDWRLDVGGICPKCGSLDDVFYKETPQSKKAIFQFSKDLAKKIFEHVEKNPLIQK